MQGTVGILPRFCKIRHFHNQISAPAYLVEAELHHLRLGRNLNALYFFDGLDPRLHLGRVRGTGGETGDKLLLLGKHCLLPLVRSDKLLPPEHPLPQIEIVISRVGSNGPARHFDCPAAEPGHKLAVVARHHHGTFKSPEPAFKPDDGLQIQVIGRLVHKQHIGIKQEDLRQADPHFPAAAETLHRQIPPLLPYSQTIENRLCPVLQLVAAQVLELHLQFPVAVHLTVAQSIPIRICHAVLQLPKLPADLIDSPGPGKHLLQGGASRHLPGLLGKIADDRSAVDRNGALIRSLRPGDEPEKRRLARAVRTYEPDLLPVIYLKSAVPEQGPAAAGHADI